MHLCFGDVTLTEPGAHLQEATVALSTREHIWQEVHLHQCRHDFCRGICFFQVRS